MSDSTPLRSLHVVLLIVSGVSSAICLAPTLLARPQAVNFRNLQEYVGTWALQVDGKNFLILRLNQSSGGVSGGLTMPAHFQLDPGGDFSHVSSEIREKPILEAVIVDGDLHIKAGSATDADDFVFHLSGHGHAWFQFEIGSILEPQPPWQLVRVDDSEKVTFAEAPENSPYPAEILALQTKLAEMVARDQAVRNEVPILESKVREVDQANYPEVLRIYEKYKWPLISVMGRTAAHNYWLLVQHQDLEFQARVLADMQRAADGGEASKVDYAYLYDRVMTEEGKPQHWGTQGDCKNGKAVLSPVDDPQGLQQRRTELRIFPANEDEYLKLLDSQCANFKPDTLATGTQHP